MLRCLFWNLNREPRGAALAWLGDRFDLPDVVVAECTMPDIELLPAINAGAPRTFVWAPGFA